MPGEAASPGSPSTELFSTLPSQTEKVVSRFSNFMLAFSARSSKDVFYYVISQELNGIFKKKKKKEIDMPSRIEDCV